MTVSKHLDRQNALIDKENKKLKDKHTTENQRVYYEKLNIQSQNYLLTRLFVIYYIVIVIAAYFLVTSNYFGLRTKILLAILFAIYPFIIYYIEYYIYYFIYYFYTIIYGVPYKK